MHNPISNNPLEPTLIFEKRVLMKNFRIVLINHKVMPYRLSFYEKLVSNDSHEWLIIHSNNVIEDGRPAYEGKLNFPNEKVLLKEYKLGPYTIRFQKGVIGLVKSFDPDIVIVVGISGLISNWLVLIWAYLHGKKRIIWSCGWEAQQEKTLYLWLKQKLLYIYNNLASYHLVYSTKALNYFKQLGLSSDNITVCYNSLEIEHLLGREAEIRSLGKKLRRDEGLDGEILFLFVGGLAIDKKVDLLIRAFNDIECENINYKLWIVGDGPEKANLQKLAEGNKKIKFWGRNFGNVEQYFAAADYFVLPGTGGLALNQAMFWEVPCIVGAADGTEDDLVIHRETGIRFQPENVNSLRDAMIYCIKNPLDVQRKMGRTARQLIIERSNVNNMVKIFHSTITSLVVKSMDVHVSNDDLDVSS
jgi:glycosyltransferase involved in cell wall biosynthesis